MSNATMAAHSKHLVYAQDHYRWRQDYIEAVAVLKRAEGAAFAHEARSLTHDAEIARHGEQIAHAKAPPADGNARLARKHVAGAEHHSALLEAIRTLGAHIKE